uniref:Proline-rich protein n=1 Tax=Brachypodium distachyon TaxID=15368 RepID=C3SAB6_BRADI|nr:proline-rich protein [Brachypodium distachyon]
MASSVGNADISPTSSSSRKLALFLLALMNLSLLLGAVNAGGCAGPHCPTPATSTTGVCPINTLKLGVCANVLNLLKLKIGVPASEQCCPLLTGLADLDAAVCVCSAIRAKVLGVVNLNVPVDLVLLLNYCRKTCPPGFTCPL